jgi:hypothetical protein
MRRMIWLLAMWGLSATPPALRVRTGEIVVGLVAALLISRKLAEGRTAWHLCP